MYGSYFIIFEECIKLVIMSLIIAIILSRQPSESDTKPLKKENDYRN